MGTRENIVRITLIALLSYALLNLLTVRREVQRGEQFVTGLEAEYAAELEKNDLLTQKLAHVGEAESMEALARSRLGLVRPGEIIYYFTEDREEQPWYWK